LIFISGDAGATFPFALDSPLKFTGLFFNQCAGDIVRLIVLTAAGTTYDAVFMHDYGYFIVHSFAKDGFGGDLPVGHERFALLNNINTILPLASQEFNRKKSQLTIVSLASGEYKNICA
jgi:hypothetical protein